MTFLIKLRALPATQTVEGDIIRSDQANGNLTIAKDGEWVFVAPWAEVSFVRTQ